MEYAIELEGLSKTYGRKSKAVHALRPTDLRVPRGCIFGLLGPNGAGKSTLVKTLLSIVRPTAGSAKLLGRDFRRASARDRVGYLPEGHQFPRYLTGRQVLHYFGALGGLRGRRLIDETIEKLALCGATDYADLKVGKYSKGMKQRIGLAQALLGKPEIVFLDEPTDGVDPLGRRDVRVVLEKLGAQGTTVFLNSHLLSEIELLCNTVAIMNEGRIVKMGTIEEVTGRSGALQVEFRTSPLPEALCLDLAGFGSPKINANGFSLDLPNEKDVSQVIDVLRASRVEIYEVQQGVGTLEDAFLRIIQEAGTG